jgi:sarcosine oxidase subunit alpha
MPAAVNVVGRASGVGLPAVAHRVVPIDRRVFVDLAHDVTTKDLQISIDEGFDSVELAKRWTSTGMAPDQGKTGNVDTIQTMAQIRGVSPKAIGTTKFRPPYEPVPIGAMAGPSRGPLARLVRRLPLHDWHVAQGAAMEDYSGWWRAAVYARSGESESAAIAREVIHTRSHVGVFDGSSLTKVLVAGADATKFLQRIYANGVAGLTPGRVRYGLMLNDEGIVRDDGVLARMSPNRYLVSASSAGGAERYRTMDRLLHVDWPDLDVVIDLVTTQWCTLAVCGPYAAEIVGRVLPGVDTNGMPHMSVRETHFEGRAVIVMRVSFTGEASFEISIGASHGVKLLTAVWQEGRRHRVAPFGLEALDVMRLEKGHFEVGVDTDVDTSPIDIGWGASLAKKKTDFIGRRSLELAAFADRGRNQLVGLESQRVLPVGSILIDAQRKIEGHVTSSAWSPTLQRPIALALLADGRERIGRRSTVVVESRDVAATVASPRFFDPDDSRLAG